MPRQQGGNRRYHSPVDSTHQGGNKRYHSPVDSRQQGGDRRYHSPVDSRQQGGNRRYHSPVDSRQQGGNRRYHSPADSRQQGGNRGYHSPVDSRQQGGNRRYHSPVDSRGTTMPRQQGGVVDDGLVLWQVDDLVGDELGAEGQHVEVNVQRLVLLQDLWHCHLLHLPALVLEHRHILRHRSLGCDSFGSHCVTLSRKIWVTRSTATARAVPHEYSILSCTSTYIL